MLFRSTTEYDQYRYQISQSRKYLIGNILTTKSGHTKHTPDIQLCNGCKDYGNQDNKSKTFLILSGARDFMINRGFTYCVPPFMIRSNVVTGVMSFAEMDAMMYKIEGEDLYLIGTSEHSMIGKFIDQIIPEEELPKTLTSYSPCFRKEKGAHGLEERGSPFSFSDSFLAYVQELLFIKCKIQNNSDCTVYAKTQHPIFDPQNQCRRSRRI